MVLENNINITTESVINNVHRFINQIYKLLPLREENADWELPLSTIIVEIAGMNELLIGQHEILFSLLCKLKGLQQLNTKNDFFSYRRTIFECLSLLNTLVDNLNE